MFLGLDVGTSGLRALLADEGGNVIGVADAAYGVLAVSYIASAITLTFIHSHGQSAPSAQEPILQNLKALGVEIRRNNSLLALLVVAAAVEILGFSHQVLLPVIARDVLNVGAEGLGLMNALRSIGGIIAILALSSLGEVRRKGMLYLVALHVFGVSLLFLGIANTFFYAILAIIVINGMGALSDILSQSLVQTVVPNELRGRAMGSWVLAVGLGPVGHLQIGALASALGVSFALMAHGIGLIALSVGALVFFPKLRKL